MQQSNQFRLNFDSSVRLFRACVLILCCCWPFHQGQAQDAPRRIVSLNLCTDQLVLWLAQRDHIASVTWLAAQAGFSSVHELTAGIHLNHARAEEILPLAPDLILASEFSGGATVNLLRRLGYEVHMIGFPSTLETTLAQILEVATLLGEQQKGEAMVASIQSRIETALADMPQHDSQPLAVFYASNGYTYGQHTLRDDFLQDLGFRNLGAEVEINGPGLLSLETLLAARPDFLLVNSLDDNEAPLAQPLLQHPALRKSLQDHTQLIELPDVLFQCSGPMLAEAYERMARAMNGGQHHD
jgi:iron complex transport system substrate-binding protein